MATPSTKKPSTKSTGELLRDLKHVINTEMAEDLTSLQRSLRAEIASVPTRSELSALRVEIAGLRNEISTLRNEVVALRAAAVVSDKKISAVADSTQSQNDRQLALVKNTTSELMKTAATQIERRVLARVATEIDTKVMPQIDNMVGYVKFQLEDGAELINDYRFAAYAQVDTKRLTDGKVDRTILGPGVGMFRQYDDSESD